MKVLTEECNTAKKIRALEQYLRDNGIEITFRGDGLMISLTDEQSELMTFMLVNTESKEPEQTLPCFTDDNRIQWLQDYITGK